jgi:hypothetical protein
MTDHAGHQRFLRQYRSNVKQPPKDWREHLCDTLDYIRKLPSGTTMTRYIKENAPGAKQAFNYGSLGNADEHDNIRPVHPPQEHNRIDDLPLFQKS